MTHHARSGRLRLFERGGGLPSGAWHLLVFGALGLPCRCSAAFCLSRVSVSVSSPSMDAGRVAKDKKWEELSDVERDAATLLGWTQVRAGYTAREGSLLQRIVWVVQL